MLPSRRDLLLTSLSAAGGCLAGAALRGLWVDSSPLSDDPRTAAKDTGGTRSRGEHGGEEHGGEHGSGAVAGPTAAEALELLLAGNERFVQGKANHPHESPEWRARLVSEQHPYAVILGCADSRVSPELLFDEGLGGLFVVRQAGHVADDDTLGSIEYAVAHLHVPLVMVLGHESCGAVTAAVRAIQDETPVEGHILRLVDDIAPAVFEEQAKPQHALLDAVVRTNVRQVVERLRNCGPVLRPRARRGELQVVGAYYHLDSGQVEVLDG